MILNHEPFWRSVTHCDYCITSYMFLFWNNTIILVHNIALLLYTSYVVLYTGKRTSCAWKIRVYVLGQCAKETMLVWPKYHTYYRNSLERSLYFQRLLEWPQNNCLPWLCYSSSQIWYYVIWNWGSEQNFAFGHTYSSKRHHAYNLSNRYHNMDHFKESCNAHKVYLAGI